MLISRQDKLKMGLILMLRLNMTLKIKANQPPKNRNLNQAVLHFSSKFGDSSINGWHVIPWSNWWLTHAFTERQTQATTRPKGQNWPRIPTYAVIGNYSDHRVSLADIMNKTIYTSRLQIERYCETWVKDDLMPWNENIFLCQGFGNTFFEW